MIDVIEQFREAMHEAGIQSPKVIQADGRIHRFSTNGRQDDDAGWYVLHDDGIPAGAFGDWRSGIRGTWRADNERRLSEQEEREHRARLKAILQEREADEEIRRTEARNSAKAIWKAAAPASGDHEYLLRKAVRAHGLRLYEGALVVPVTADGELHSLQFISGDGGKRFLPGGRVSGCYFLIGTPLRTLCIAEGYATAASIREATGHAVAVAFNAGNLQAVARILKAKHPETRVILCADDDVASPGNPGLTKAREAAEAIAGYLAVPDFGPAGPERVSDFNDLHRLVGLDAVRECIESAILVDRDNAETWPQPGPIRSALRPVPEFDADTLLPEALRDWIMDEADRMPCPPEFIAAAVVVALGSIVGARCAIRPKSLDSWQIVPNIWGGIVGNPSAKKSPAISSALKPLEQLIRKARAEHREALADYDSKKLVFEARKDAFDTRIRDAAKKSGCSDPIEEIAEQRRRHDELAPEAPRLRRYKTNDTTVEKLGELLRDNPAGLLVLRDELVGLITAWEREGREGERAFFLEAWNGNQSFDTDRIGRGHISIPNLCVSIFGGIQPDKLTGYLEQATRSLSNDGMLQRFQVLVYPDQRRWEWRDRAPNTAASASANAVFEAFADLDPLAWGAAAADDTAKCPYFCFDAEAQAVFIEWCADLFRERIPNEAETIFQQHLAKFDKLFPALALIFHLVECASNGRRGLVGRSSALRAAAWCEFLEAHARRCYGLILDDGLRAAQALADKIERGELNDGFTLRDVRRQQYRNLTTDATIQAALKWLEDENWLRGETVGGTGPGSGRRTVRYRINPAVNGAPKEGET